MKSVLYALFGVLLSAQAQAMPRCEGGSAKPVGLALARMSGSWEVDSNLSRRMAEKPALHLFNPDAEGDLVGLEFELASRRDPSIAGDFELAGSPGACALIEGRMTRCSVLHSGKFISFDRRTFCHSSSFVVARPGPAFDPVLLSGGVAASRGLPLQLMAAQDRKSDALMVGGASDHDGRVVLKRK